MFVQVIRGKVQDEGGFRKQHEKWQQEVSSGAVGYLGSTAGTTEDGRFFIAARFQDEESARKNSDRPEQGAWWAETEPHLSDVSFEEFTDIETYKGGGSDAAGFVQVMRYKLNDIEKARALWKQMESQMGEMRPDVLGGQTLVAADGSITDIIYFSSEAEARAKEAEEPTPEVVEMMQQWQGMIEGDTEYIDLKEPSLHTA